MMRRLSNSSPDSGASGPSLLYSDLNCDHAEVDRLHRITGKYPFLRRIGRFQPILLASLASGCGAASAPEPESVSPESVEEVVVAGCVDGGRLETTLYGAVEGDIKWRSSDMACEGMPRPDGEGARLRFSGPHPAGTGQLVLIAAIPDLERDSDGSELPTRLTVIEEGQGRFFTSPDFDICWADIQQNEAAGEHGDSVAGRIYCITPINEVNGSATMSVSDIVFAGRIDWSAS